MTEADKLNSSAGRRRFIKGVAASAPIIMTVANRPAWGGGSWGGNKWWGGGGKKGGGGNLCWSGIQSGNLSQHTKDTCDFGKSPGYYANNVKGDPGWPGYHHNMFDSGCHDLKWNGSISDACKELFKDVTKIGDPGVHGTKFGEVFIGASGDLAIKTLMQVLWQDSGSFAFHAIATYFNALNFDNYSFTPAKALEIINDILSTGSYTDDTGAIWSEEEMKDLFDSLYHPY